RVDIRGRELRARRFVIATGSAPWAPPIQGSDRSGYLTSTTDMELLELPESLVVIGGNYIGLELGQVFANLGSRVTDRRSARPDRAGGGARDLRGDDADPPRRWDPGRDLRGGDPRRRWSSEE